MTEQNPQNLNLETLLKDTGRAMASLPLVENGKQIFLPPAVEMKLIYPDFLAGERFIESTIGTEFTETGIALHTPHEEWPIDNGGRFAMNEYSWQKSTVALELRLLPANGSEVIFWVTQGMSMALNMQTGRLSYVMPVRPESAKDYDDYPLGWDPQAWQTMAHAQEEAYKKWRLMQGAKLLNQFTEDSSRRTAVRIRGLSYGINHEVKNELARFLVEHAEKFEVLPRLK